MLPVLQTFQISRFRFTEVLKFAGLDYTVAKRKLFKFDNENEIANEDIEIKIPEIEVPNFYATIRTDNETVLGVVGKDYEVVQNINAFSFFDSIVGGAYNLIEQYFFLLLPMMVQPVLPQLLHR